MVFTKFYEWFDHVHLHFLNQNKSSAKLALLGKMFYEHKKKKLMVVRCSADKFYNFLNNLTRDLILQKQNILHMLNKFWKIIIALNGTLLNWKSKLHDFAWWCGGNCNQCHDLYWSYLCKQINMTNKRSTWPVMAPWISRRVQQLLFVLLLRLILWGFLNCQKIHGSESESIKRPYSFEIVIRIWPEGHQS